MNRFKGLDLVDRVPEELWVKFHNIVQEAVTKTILKKKKCKKTKWLSEETSQIAEERREVKAKGERERCTQLNAEFQRTARRPKKAFFFSPSKTLLNLLQYCFSFMFWFWGHETCRISAPWWGIRPTPLALEGEVLTTGPLGKPQEGLLKWKMQRNRGKQ